MNRLIAFVAAGCLAALFAGSSFAELTADKAKEAQALIKQFSAPEFAARQQAVDKLIEMGPDVMPLIRKALAETTDNEVKLRCGMALKGIAAKNGLTLDGNAVKKANCNPSLITLDVKDAPLSDVLDALAAQSGNARVAEAQEGMPGGQMMKTDVTISVKDKPYWEALDAICRQVGACYDMGWQPKQKVMLRSDDSKADEMSVYAGPVVVKLDSVQRSETVTHHVRFRTDRNYGQAGNEENQSSNLNFNMRFFVEDRLPLLGTWMESAKATTPDGVVHVSRTMGMMGRRFDQGGNTSGGQFQLMFQNEEAKFDKPVTIDGKVAIELAGACKEVKIAGVSLDAAPGEKSGRDDKIEIHLKGVEKKDFTVKLSLELSADAGLPIFVGGPESPFGFALVDSKGKRYSKINTFDWKSQQGSMNRMGGGNGTRLDQFGQQGNTGELNGELTMTFDGIRTVEGDWSVVFTYPENVETREFPFTFKNVPVP